MAVALERHFNSPGYKVRLAGSGTRLTSRVVCAYDGKLAVECSGRMRTGALPVRAEWRLVKRSPTRARLTWTFTALGVREHAGAVVSAATFRLRAF